jgi:pyridoxal phosphate enzyme (YggS family)
MGIADNIAEIRERIASAAQRAGRNGDDVVLMGVSKTFPAEAIITAYVAGIRVFGENRVQEFAEKSLERTAAEKTVALGNLPEAEWHLIGHLQSNKASKAVELFHAVDTVDSLRLAERLNAAAATLGKKLRVLIEINIGGEEAKAGLLPGAPEFEQILQTAPRLDHLEIQGLMTIPPFAENPEDARPYFRKLRELLDATAVRRLPNVGMNVLSMGMSHDFEIAIEEGSTCVRVGTAIFGKREFGGTGVLARAQT